MKLVKMSLAAAVLLGTSAFAIDNIKVSGDAKLFYYTDDQGNNDLFDKGSSAADTALRLGVTGDLTKYVSFGVTGYAISTLGLENNLVDNTWSGAHGVRSTGAGYAEVDDKAWIGELWLAGTFGATTVKGGRMELDTPLAFSEKWSIVPNTFDAVVAINQSIPDFTFVGAWVGKGNGYNAVGYGLGLGSDNSTAVGIDGGVVGRGASFVTYDHNGAYAAAIINNSYKPLTVQAWYYNVQSIADAYWVQGDINCRIIDGLKLGVQYADISPMGVLSGLNDSSAWAFKVGYEGLEGVKFQAAYSTTDSDGVLKIANTATNNLGGAQSKLYTEAWWNYGYVGAPDTDAFNFTAEWDIKDAVKLGAYYTYASIGNTNAAYSATQTTLATLSGNPVRYVNADMQEIALTASKSFGPLDATIAYVSTDADDQNNGSQYNSLQAYFTLNF